MRIIYMGTPEFAAAPLRNIIESGYDVVGVVTQSDKPKGRGEKVSFSAVKTEALQHDIEVFQPERMRDESSIAWVADKAPDIIVVAAFGQILPKEILELPKYGCINIHASLLPRLRGAAPIQQAVIDGDEYSGITIMRMDEGLDTGDILIQERVKIADDETGGSLHDKLMEIGSRIIITALDKIEKGELSGKPQEGESSYAGMLNKKMGHINFDEDASRTERLIRGLNPWPSAYCYLNGKMIKIWEAQVVPESTVGFCQGKKNGEIISVTNDKLYIKTGKDILSVKSLQIEGKKRMDIASFLRGNKINEGDMME